MIFRQLFFLTLFAASLQLSAQVTPTQLRNSVKTLQRLKANPSLQQVDMSANYLYRLKVYDTLCPKILETIFKTIHNGRHGNQKLKVFSKYPDQRFDPYVARLLPSLDTTRDINFYYANALNMALNVRGKYSTDKLEALFNETAEPGENLTDYLYYKKKLVAGLLENGGIEATQLLLPYYFLDTIGVAELRSSSAISNALRSGLDRALTSREASLFFAYVMEEIAQRITEDSVILEVVKASPPHQKIIAKLQALFAGKESPATDLTFTKLHRAGLLADGLLPLRKIAEAPLYLPFNRVGEDDKHFLRPLFGSTLLPPLHYPYLDRNRFHLIHSLGSYANEAFADSAELTWKYQSLLRALGGTIDLNFHITSPLQFVPERFVKGSTAKDSLYVDVSHLLAMAGNNLQLPPDVSRKPFADFILYKTFQDFVFYLYAIAKNREKVTNPHLVDLDNADSVFAVLHQRMSARPNKHTKLTSKEITLQNQLTNDLKAYIRKAKLVKWRVLRRTLNLEQNAYSESIQLTFRNGVSSTLVHNSQIPISFSNLLSKYPYFLDLTNYSLGVHELQSFYDYDARLKNDLDVLRIDPFFSSVLLVDCIRKKLPLYYCTDLLYAENHYGVPVDYLELVKKDVKIPLFDYKTYTPILPFRDPRSIAIDSFRTYYANFLAKPYQQYGSFICEDSLQYQSIKNDLLRPRKDILEAKIWYKLDAQMAYEASRLPDLRKNRWYEFWRIAPSEVDLKNRMKASYISHYTSLMQKRENLLAYLHSLDINVNELVEALNVRRIVLAPDFSQALIAYELITATGIAKSLVAEVKIAEEMKPLIPHLEFILQKDENYFEKNNMDVGLKGVRSAERLVEETKRFYAEVFDPLASANFAKAKGVLSNNPRYYYYLNNQNINSFYATPYGENLLKELYMISEIINKANPALLFFSYPTPQPLRVDLTKYLSDQEEQINRLAAPGIQQIAAQFADKRNIWDDGGWFIGVTVGFSDITKGVSFQYISFPNFHVSGMLTLFIHYAEAGNIKPF